MATFRQRRMDGTRNGKHLAALLQGIARGDQRATLQRRFYDQAAARQSADQPVTPRKIGGERGRAQCEFGDQGPLFGKLVRQVTIARRVDDIESGADHGNRRRRGGETAQVSGRIDAQRQSADDGETALRQFLRKRLGIDTTLLACVAASHDGQRSTVEQISLALDVQQGRRVSDFQQQPGIGVVGKGNDLIAGFLQPSQGCLEAFRVGTAHNGCGDIIADAAYQRCVISRANGLGRRQRGKQLAKTGRGQSGNQPELDPGNRFLVRRHAPQVLLRSLNHVE